ncbi:transglycosylase domain-containing protein [Streptomyces sp. RFCAC02]|uniref:transglycosylase domain-containing protein n=1 Tax=Streptomyces sp. RFCAC02 TaxID=2499143 RepID=UPI0010202C79|nr:transglycosylase domain-containing protein [Streptomyces sp. RFCAC02]
MSDSGDPGQRAQRRGRAGSDPRWASRTALAAASPAPARRRRGLRRLIPPWRVALGGVLLAVVVVMGALVAGYLLVDIPEPKAAAAAQSNVYLYADGSRIAVAGDVNRENVPLSEVPLHVRRAVLAAEDRSFYDDPPVDLRAMTRAAWNMVRGEGKQSGSTITQQYVKNYYLDQRQTIGRKVKELFIAVKLGREKSKDDILEGYLNTSYFGRDAYGIQAAARAYYDKEAADLTVEEGAYLAALLNAPSSYDVRAVPENRDRAVARWNYVLDGMVSEGWLKQDRREEMSFPEPGEISTDRFSGERGYLVEAVAEWLRSNGVADEDELHAGGYRITTTIDPDRQDALTRAVEEGFLDGLDADAPPDAWARVGATSVDVASGEVVAMYGGRDYTEQFVNNATRRDYQAASTFKPFVYAAALDHDAETRDGDRIGPRTRYDGDSGREVVDRDGEKTGWAPENENDEDYGEITVAEAMDQSVNAVFAQMGEDVGTDRVKDTAVALGIPDNTPGLDSAEGSISLGTATPSTLHVAEAYATLARHGEHRQVTLVSGVTQDGEEVELPERPVTRAVSRDAADGTTELLRDVVRVGTGAAAQAAGRPAAGKTGTAEDDKAAWFAGYTPGLATVVAVFGQDPESGAQKELYGVAGQERISGGGFPAQIWARYTAEALDGEPVREFDLRTRRPAPELRPGGQDSDTAPDEDPGETGDGGEDGGEEETDEPDEPSAPSSGPGRRDEEDAPAPGGTGGTGDEETAEPTGPAQPSPPTAPDSPGTDGGDATD